MTLEQEIELVRQDAAMAWDKCEQRRLNEERLTAALQKMAADPLRTATAYQEIARSALSLPSRQRGSGSNG